MFYGQPILEPVPGDPEGALYLTPTGMWKRDLHDAWGYLVKRERWHEAEGVRRMLLDGEGIGSLVDYHAELEAFRMDAEVIVANAHARLEEAAEDIAASIPPPYGTWQWLMHNAMAALAADQVNVLMQPNPIMEDLFCIPAMIPIEVPTEFAGMDYGRSPAMTALNDIRALTPWPPITASKPYKRTVRDRVKERWDDLRWRVGRAIMGDQA